MVALLPILLSATACGTLEVSIERTATVPEPAPPTPTSWTPVPTATGSPVKPTATKTPTPAPADYLNQNQEGGKLGDVWNLADLRYGLHSDRVQIVWEMDELRNHVPYYEAVEVDNASYPFPTGHDPAWGEARIDLVISDLYAREAPAMEELPIILANDPLVARIGSYPTFSDAHLGFSIGLKEPAAYAVYELTDPVRIVIAVFYPPGLTRPSRPTATSTLVPTPIPATPIPPTAVPSPTQPTPTTTAASQTITITYTCTYPWFFPDPPTVCAGQPPVVADTVAQTFERGLMIWREQPDFYLSQIYTFFADDLWPYWNPSNNQWEPGMPESDPAIIPPDGYYQPVRGFGEFWRNAYFGTIELSAQDRLGWAIEEEASLGPLPMQCHADGSYLPLCYLAGPGGAVYALRPDNSWFIWDSLASAPQPSTTPPEPVAASTNCAAQEPQEIEPPQLSGVRLEETETGYVIRVVGYGGHLISYGICGLRYDDSERSFQLTLDGEPAGSMTCLRGPCEATLELPVGDLLGDHTITVEGGSSITFQVAED
jgi:hypothetical protein